MAVFTWCEAGMLQYWYMTRMHCYMCMYMQHCGGFEKVCEGQEWRYGKRTTRRDKTEWSAGGGERILRRRKGQTIKRTYVCSIRGMYATKQLLLIILPHTMNDGPMAEIIEEWPHLHSNRKHYQSYQNTHSLSVGSHTGDKPSMYLIENEPENWVHIQILYTTVD